MSLKEVFSSGIIKENPVFVLLLALCPALGVTSTLENSLGMGIMILLVLMVSGLIISAMRKIIPPEIRIPIFITIIATAVTVGEMFMQAFMPDLFNALGIFLPLAVTNCIIFGRAEAFAYKNTVMFSVVDGISMGLGFTLAMGMMGISREILGTGAVDFLGVYARLFPQEFAIPLFVQPAGAFIALGVIIGIIFTLKISKEEKMLALAKASKAKGGAK